MTANWTLILNWIIQGLILGGFALAGVYLALRIFASQRSAPPSSPAYSPAAAPVPPAVPSVPTSRPATGATAPASGPAKPKRGRRPTQDPDFDAVRHAFEFGDDNRLTMILEMPASYLADDATLVELWVDAVGWARLEQSHQSGNGSMEEAPPPSTTVSGSANTEHLQSHLDQVLQRLQLSADRRGQLRAMLDQKMPSGEPET